MADNPYADFGFYQVEIRVSRDLLNSKERLFCELRVVFRDPETDLPGNSAMCNFDIDPMPGATLEACERAAAEAGLNLLRRLSGETANTIIAARTETWAEAAKPLFPESQT